MLRAPMWDVQWASMIKTAFFSMYFISSIIHHFSSSLRYTTGLISPHISKYPIFSRGFISNITSCSALEKEVSIYRNTIHKNHN
jgi:hypothetical protein